jgi:hypothetical protein
VKEIEQSSEISLKEQTCESWALKKEKRWKPKLHIIYSTKKPRKCPKSQETDANPIQEASGHQADMTKIEPLHSIFLLK